jgi:hypothetical protein
MSSPRRFPSPWSIEELNDVCFIVHDHNGQALAYVYFEDEPGRRCVRKTLSKRISEN